MKNDKNEDVETVITAIGCVSSVIIVPFLIAYSGFVLSYLWLWFLVPLGVAPISIFHALGISTLIGLYPADSNSPKQDGENPGWKLMRRILNRVIQITFALFFGYVWHLFMKP
jgi:hypothetical protein